MGCSWANSNCRRNDASGQIPRLGNDSVGQLCLAADISSGFFAKPSGSTFESVYRFDLSFLCIHFFIRQIDELVERIDLVEVTANDPDAK
jgi:hypothetical protein